MKYLVRTAMTAVVSLTAAAAALLPAGPATASAATAAAAVPAHHAGLDDSALIGTWTNIDPTSTSIQNITVSKSASGGVLVDVFGACVMSSTQTPCEWGNVHAVAFRQVNAAGIDTTSGTSYRAEWSWDHGRARSILVANMVMHDGMPLMVVEQPRIYLPRQSSGSNANANLNPNWIVSEMFAPGNPIAPTKNGTTVTDNYPMGNLAAPDSSLLGTWMNPTPNKQGIVKVVVTKNRHNNSVDVHTWGACAQGACDWGTTYGVTLGPTPSGGNAIEFVAPYSFHGKDVLLCAEIENEAGDMLMINEYTNDAHHHQANVNDPDNHTVDENFMKS
jgi:hypothetical protein